MGIDQSLDLDVSVIIWVGVVNQRHIINIFANLFMNFDMACRSLIMIEGRDDVVFEEIWYLRLSNFEPEQDLKYDRDVNNVSHNATEDARAILEVSWNKE